MRRVLLAGLSLVLALALAEGIVRSVVDVDEDGQRWLAGRRLLPWRMPLSQIEKNLGDFYDPASLFVYDPDLGWAPRPGAQSRDGLQSIDPSGGASLGGCPQCAGPARRHGRGLVHLR